MYDKTQLYAGHAVPDCKMECLVNSSNIRDTQALLPYELSCPVNSNITPRNYRNMFSITQSKAGYAALN